MDRDIAEKRLEEHADVFADIFNVLVFEGDKVCRADTLEAVQTESYHHSETGEMRQRTRDVVKRDIRNGAVLLIAGIENQESYDNTMVVRVMGYDFASYDRQIGEIMRQNKEEGNPAFVKRLHDGQKLVPVITLVLYFSQGEWLGPRNLTGLLHFPEEYETAVLPFIPDYQLNLIELAKLPESVRERFTSDFRLVSEFIASQGDPVLRRKFMEDTEYKVGHPQELLDMLGAIGRDSRYKAVRKQVLRRGEEEEITMCVIAEELENRGIQKGIQKGIRKGIQKGIQKGEERLSRLNLMLLSDKRYGELEKASLDEEYRHRLFREYDI